MTDSKIVDGINLEEIRAFASRFKHARLELGITQTQVGQALSTRIGPSYSQSAICRFEKLDITPKSAAKIKPILEEWIAEVQEQCRSGNPPFQLDSFTGGSNFSGADSSRKRKRRTSFTPAALDYLIDYFDKTPHPSGQAMSQLSEQLNYDREVIRVWFCNRRQNLRNQSLKRGELGFSSGSEDSEGFKVPLPPTGPLLAEGLQATFQEAADSNTHLSQPNPMTTIQITNQSAQEILNGLMNQSKTNQSSSPQKTANC